MDGSPDAADALGDGSDGSFEAGPDATHDGGKCGKVILAPVSATASAGALQPASNAIDGNLGTRWESVHDVDPQWIDLDFGAPVFVSEVQILWQHSCAANYTIEVSNDAVTWTAVKTITGNTLESVAAPADWTGAADHAGLTAVGRYLRINGTARCIALAGHGYSIWEMRAFGDTHASCNP
jgi:hypothetical protein